MRRRLSSSYSVIFRGADRTRDGCLSATLVTRTRFDELDRHRIGTSDNMGLVSNPRAIYNIDPLGSLAFDDETGHFVRRNRLLTRLQLPALAGLDSTIFSAMAMCVTGFVISGLDLGDAGRVPFAHGEGHVPLAEGTISWTFPLTNSALIPYLGGLPNFGLMGHRRLREVFSTWDVIARRVGDPATAPLLNAIAGSFTRWVKDLVRWASTSHPEELSQPHYVHRHPRRGFIPGARRGVPRRGARLKLAPHRITSGPASPAGPVAGLSPRLTLAGGGLHHSAPAHRAKRSSRGAHMALTDFSWVRRGFLLWF